MILLANRKPHVVLGDPGVPIGVELGGRDGGDAELLDEEPGELEVAGARGHVGREGVVPGEPHARHVHHDEVAALGLRVGQAELAPHFVEARHLAVHVAHGFVPEPFAFGLFEAWGLCWLVDVLEILVGGGVFEIGVLIEAMDRDKG